MKKQFNNCRQNGNQGKFITRFAVVVIICLSLLFLVSCGSNRSTDHDAMIAKDTSDAKAEVNQTDEQTILEIQEETQKLTENIIGVLAEPEPNKELEATIINYLEIPEDYFSSTKYYYNYVDLNCDGKDEIFTVVMGPYTSGSGGSTALFIILTNEGMQVNQKFTLIQTPVIISDKITKGCKEIVVMNSGGGAAGNYVVLTCSDGQYTTVNEGTVIKDLDGISGIAIIFNDILKDMEEGKTLYLQKN